MNIDTIRRRMKRDYIFDQPGDMVVDRDTDLAWALDQLKECAAARQADRERIRVLEQENEWLRQVGNIPAPEEAGEANQDPSPGGRDG